MIRLISQQLLRETSEQAKLSPRLRKNFNFHYSNDSKCHRLINALEPGTYVQPHCHLSAEMEETLVVLKGKFGLLLFDEFGTVKQATILSPEHENFGITIPVGVFHSMVALVPNSIFFEAKAGPYVPIAPEEKASWAPSEHEPECTSYLEKMYAYFP